MNKIESTLPVKSTLTKDARSTVSAESVPAAKREQEAGERDDLVLTGLAVMLKLAEKSQKMLPEMDLGKIADIKEKIAQGDYQVSAGRVAQKMIDFERMQ